MTSRICVPFMFMLMTLISAGAMIANPAKSGASSTTSSIPWTTSPIQQNRQQSLDFITPPSIRIRATRESDLPHVASMLATTSSAGGKAVGWNNWRAKVDQLFAKSDIEALITSRFYAIEEGKKAHRKTLKLLKNLDAEEMRAVTESDRLRLFWSQTSDKFRTNLDKAVRQTAEDHVWRSHNTQLPPCDRSWLQHVQLSACSKGDGSVVGFCEVAILWNPVTGTFSPAIANLATAAPWRRRGVATRLVETACRFVSIYWCQGDESPIGLYVEKSNSVAMSLYEKLGFEATVTCDGGDLLGDMWYMSRDTMKLPKRRARQLQQSAEARNRPDT